MSDAALRPVPAHRRLRTRLLRRERLIGTFLKTPTGHAAEMLGALGFDFVAIDQEHAPFDRQSTDAALVAARGADTAALVRVSHPEAILPALDGGAAGVLVPHVSSAAMAREVVAMCRYRGGRRGFAATTRAGGYGTASMAEHIAASDAATAVIAQIEDPEALDEIDAIAAVPGIDCLFVGRADLAAALEDEAAVARAARRIADAGARAGKPVGLFVTGRAEADRLAGLGATLFVLNSDHGFMRQAATAAAAELRDLWGKG